MRSAATVGDARTFLRSLKLSGMRPGEHMALDAAFCTRMDIGLLGDRHCDLARSCVEVFSILFALETYAKTAKQAAPIFSIPNGWKANGQGMYLNHL